MDSNEARMMRMKSVILAMLAVLTCVCSRASAHAQVLDSPYVEDKQSIIQAVLEAELRRQNQPFTKVIQLSSENVGLIPSLEISGTKIVVLDATTIRGRVRVGS